MEKTIYLLLNNQNEFIQSFDLVTKNSNEFSFNCTCTKSILKAQVFDEIAFDQLEDEIGVWLFTKKYHWTSYESNELRNTEMIPLLEQALADLQEATLNDFKLDEASASSMRLSLSRALNILQPDNKNVDYRYKSNRLYQSSFKHQNEEL